MPYPEIRVCALLQGLEGIFPGRLVKESLKPAARVISDGVAVNGLALPQCSFQSQCKRCRFGRIGVTLLRVAVFALCFRSLRNYLDPIHPEIRKSVCCVNPSLAAYLNSVLLVLYTYYIGRNREEFTVNSQVNNKFSEKARCCARVVKESNL